MNKRIITELEKYTKIRVLNDDLIYGTYHYTTFKLTEEQAQYFVIKFHKKKKFKDLIKLRKELKQTTKITYKELCKLEIEVKQNDQN